MANASAPEHGAMPRPYVFDAEFLANELSEPGLDGIGMDFRPTVGCAVNE